MKRILLSIALLISGFPVFSQETDDWLSSPSLPDLFNDPAQTGQQTLQPGRVVLTGREIDLLILGGSGSGLEFPSIDAFTGNTDMPLQFRRISLFAPSSTVWIAGDELKPFDHPRPRHFYVAGNQRTGVGLAVDPVNGTISGFATQGGDKFEVDGNILGELQFLVVEDAEQGSNSCSTELKDQPIDAMAQLSEPAFTSDSVAAAGESITYQAVVAVDTDTEWLAGFNNNETAALDWIADAFLAMNVFYERDVETRLLIGDVILRIGSDPYSVPSNRFDQLNEFGTYWKNNMGSIDREFAAMFSGRSISGGSFSGIAWINQYCQYGRSNGGNQVAGSYSYNAIGSSRSPASTALFIGHELGHNMGSVHTHCYSPPVDNCYNGEGGCYSGPPQCPVGGRGTVMSYCHVGGTSGAGCGSNAEFHTRVQSLLESRLSAEMANGCIAPYSDPEPQPEFSSTPIAGSTLDFGDQQTGKESPDSAIQVTNLGEASLALSSCNLSGTGAASFNINACPASIAAAATAEILINCNPVSSGQKTATLTVNSNDSDEASVGFGLICTGVLPPGDDEIFSAGFEPVP